LALRAAGAGLSVLILQFMKGMAYSELETLTHIANITVKQLGSSAFCKIGDSNFEHHRELAKKGYHRAHMAISAHTHDIIVLDEIVTAAQFNLLTTQEILALIAIKHPKTELVLTGRGAPQELIDACDLVTEMKEIKHYFQKGVTARKGIES
ncbi:MAG: cob(I)yrinic acid a,c-diamide adenosyltransferase, partial [Spirochaetes bacterium]|nr:cob(I)yrinic acid a,c-diamide adenosyltransferase [Spirochaetota bacterium]